jgi:hypothetical protein
LNLQDIAGHDAHRKKEADDDGNFARPRQRPAAPQQRIGEQSTEDPTDEAADGGNGGDEALCSAKTPSL